MCMENAETAEITVEVAYARPDKQRILRVAVKNACTLLEAVKLSGILEEFPEISLADVSFGVFGKVEKKPEQRILKAGERVEIYRPLLIDPKESRKQRAEKLKSSQGRT